MRVNHWSCKHVLCVLEEKVIWNTDNNIGLCVIKGLITIFVIPSADIMVCVMPSGDNIGLWFHIVMAFYKLNFLFWYDYELFSFEHYFWYQFDIFIFHWFKCLLICRYILIWIWLYVIIFWKWFWHPFW